MSSRVTFRLLLFFTLTTTYCRHGATIDDCPSGEYYDEHMKKCFSCQDCCPPRPANKFCAGLACQLETFCNGKPSIQSTETNTRRNITIVAVSVSAAIMIIIIIISSVFIYCKKYRKKTENKSKDIKPFQETQVSLIATEESGYGEQYVEGEGETCIKIP